MRISSHQIEGFHQVLKKYLNNITYDLFLYGSRTRDDLKGGDIDLLVITNEAGVQLFDKNHLTILVEFKKLSQIGDRRIDIKATTEDNLNQDPFLKSIKPELRKLA